MNALPDSDDYDIYENPKWKPKTWYQRLLNQLFKILYCLTGPKFIVPIIGI